MLDFFQTYTNEWEPPELTDEDLNFACADGLPDHTEPDGKRGLYTCGG